MKIGSYATACISEAPAFQKLRMLMMSNADSIGLNDELLANLQPFKAGQFAPLADVADLVWRFTRHQDENNHFADMDKEGPDGRTLLDLCAASPDHLDPAVWNSYYAAIGEERRGALPFRVWQIFQEMVDFLSDATLEENERLTRFVCAAGILAHYVGDACQPLHISQFHHGHDPADKEHSKVHSVYETTMIGRHGPELLQMIPEAGALDVPAVRGDPPTGQDAARTVVDLMRRTVERLPPLEIVDLFDANSGQGQVAAMWTRLKDRTAACMQDGAKTLARVWEAAWTAGGGNTLQLPAGPIPQERLETLYRLPNERFLPAYRLQDIEARNGRIVRAGG